MAEIDYTSPTDSIENAQLDWKAKVLDMTEEMSKLLDQANALSFLFSQKDFSQSPEIVIENCMWALYELIERAQTINSNLYQLLILIND